MTSLAKVKEHTAPKRISHVTQNGFARDRTLREGAAMPIVSHSPGPEGDSCGNVPLDEGEMAPDRQTNPSPPPPTGGGGQTKAATVHKPELWSRGGGVEGHIPTWSLEPPGPAQPKLVGATQPAIGTHHAIHPKTPPVPHPIPAVHPRGGAGGADRKLLEKEKANNCLSANKGLPKGEGTHSTKQDQSCNSDWVHYSLARAKQETCGMMWLPTGLSLLSRMSGLTLPARGVGEVVTCNGPLQSSRCKPCTALTRLNAAVGRRKSSAVSKTRSTNKVSLLTRIQGVQRRSVDSQPRWGV